MIVLCLLLLLSSGALSKSSTRFTNLKCDVFDPSYTKFIQCHLKMVGRGIVALNVYAKLLKGPFNNAKVNLSLLRKYNGFRPFMFNITYDFCNIMSHSGDILSFGTIFFNAVALNSNINHSCPYENEIIFRNLILKEEYFKFLPLPAGEYQLQVMAATDNNWKIKVYVNSVLEQDIRPTAKKNV